MRGMHAQTGRSVEGMAYIDQAIASVLTERVGTRVMRRSWGSRLPDLVDRNLSPVLLAQLRGEAAVVLTTWLPHLIEVTRVTVTADTAGPRIRVTWSPVDGAGVHTTDVEVGR